LSVRWTWTTCWPLIVDEALKAVPNASKGSIHLLEGKVLVPKVISEYSANGRGPFQMRVRGGLAGVDGSQPLHGDGVDQRAGIQWPQAERFDPGHGCASGLAVIAANQDVAIYRPIPGLQRMSAHILKGSDDENIRPQDTLCFGRCRAIGRHGEALRVGGVKGNDSSEQHLALRPFEDVGQDVLLGGVGHDEEDGLGGSGGFPVCKAANGVRMAGQLVVQLGRLALGLFACAGADDDGVSGGGGTQGEAAPFLAGAPDNGNGG